MLPAYAPCPEFERGCRGVARWQPANGHVPRGFVGAFGKLADIRLVMVVAEPGDPLDDENHDAPDPVTMIDETARYVYEAFARRATSFHANLRRLLDWCWPGEDLDTQLTRTWIVDSYLCSAPKETGPVPIGAVRACAANYLAPQLRLLSARPVIALGKKAQSRVAGFHDDVIAAWAVAPPGANRPEARASWEQAARLFRQGL